MLYSVHALSTEQAHPLSPDDATQPLHASQDRVPLLDHRGVPRVLGVRAVRLDDAVDTVDGASQATGGDEPREVPARTKDRGVSVPFDKRRGRLPRESERGEAQKRLKANEDSRIEPLARDPERRTEVVHRHAAVTLEQLSVRLDPEFARVVLGVDREDPRGQEVVFFHGGCGWARWDQVPGRADSER